MLKLQSQKQITASFIFLVLIVLVSARNQKPLKQFQFDAPQQIYSGRITGQTIVFNYSRYVSSTASEVELILFIIVGDDEKGKQLGWIKTGNAIDFHYSVVWGNHQSSYFSWYGDTFTLQTTPDQQATLSVSTSFGGLNNGFNLYVSGYWQRATQNNNLRSEAITQ